jgi:hypothetical protein
MRADPTVRTDRDTATDLHFATNQWCFLIALLMISCTSSALSGLTVFTGW